MANGNRIWEIYRYLIKVNLKYLFKEIISVLKEILLGDFDKFKFLFFVNKFIPVWHNCIANLNMKNNTCLCL